MSQASQTQLSVRGVDHVTVATIQYSYDHVQQFNEWMRKFSATAMSGKPINGTAGREEVVHINGRFTAAQIRSSLKQHGVE